MAEKYMTLAELKALFTKEQKTRELSNEQKLALQHAQQFTKLSTKKARELFQKLEKIEFISPANACKIVDLLPKHPDDIKTIFSKERFTLKEKDIEQILEIIKPYLEGE